MDYSVWKDWWLDGEDGAGDVVCQASVVFASPSAIASEPMGNPLVQCLFTRSTLRGCADLLSIFSPLLFSVLRAVGLGAGVSQQEKALAAQE